MNSSPYGLAPVAGVALCLSRAQVFASDIMCGGAEDPRTAPVLAVERLASYENFSLADRFLRGIARYAAMPSEQVDGAGYMLQNADRDFCPHLPRVQVVKLEPPHTRTSCVLEEL